MASLRAPSIRYLVAGPSHHLRNTQRRWARVHDVRFVATNGAQERILAKYRDKLDQKAKEEGHGDISTLKEAYKDKIHSLRKQAAVPGATSSLTPPPSSCPSPSSTPTPRNTFPPTSPPPPSPQSATKPSVPPGVKTLSSFLDVDKTRALPPDEISNIWRLRHAGNKQSLCATMPLSTFELISANARRHPQFILPLPRDGQGAEIHFLQWTFPSPDTATVLFTHLAEYKLRGEFSSPHTTVTHHLELAPEKGLVLLQGQVVEGRGVSVDEGKWLLMCLQKFYGMEGAKGSKQRRDLLEKFSRGDQGFKVEEVLEEAERIG